MKTVVLAGNAGVMVIEEKDEVIVNPLDITLREVLALEEVGIATVVTPSRKDVYFCIKGTSEKVEVGTVLLLLNIIRNV